MACLLHMCSYVKEAVCACLCAYTHKRTLTHSHTHKHKHTNPHSHANVLRKQTGWSAEELYDEYGEARQRTDGGRAPKRKRDAKGSELSVHAK